MERPEGLGKDEEAREAHGIRGIIEEESGAVGEIRVVGFEGVIVEETGKVGSGEWIVENVFADEEISGVKAEGIVDVEGGST